ncbi:MAG: hypothetical protein M3P53_03255, partial [Actinomycetota bacterium]|nr:hypothetical protein [Actinomycetota bacterium]
VLQSALYALGDTRGPAKIAAARVAASAVLGAVLMLQLDRVALGGGAGLGVVVLGDLPAWSPLPSGLRGDPDAAVRLGATGLALGSAVGAWLELALLRRRLPPSFGRARIGGGQGRATALAAVAAGVVAAGARPLVGEWAPLLALPAVALSSGAVYLAAAAALGVPEAAALSATLRRRLTTVHPRG